MKAAEYADRFREARRVPPLRSTIYSDVPKAEDKPADLADLIVMLCRDLMREAQKIIKDRRIQLPESTGAVVREQIEKSRAIARRLDGEIPDRFFVIFLENEYPDLFKGNDGGL